MTDRSNGHAARSAGRCLREVFVMAVSLSVEHLDKFFGDFQALRDISFHIEPGTFVTLLGPSGCGKTTLLRTIAGFLEPDAGVVRFGGQVMNDIAPNKRNTAMCFQSYALFPHKNVRDNIAFGLRMHKVPEAEQEKRIREAMEMVDLIGLEKRKPYELSGGQQQRVALARAVVVQPDVLLFDEPLSNLDAKLREKVRVDIRRIQQSLGITAVYVTHDQAEALAISDVIIAMNKGRVIQLSGPKEIYDAPKTRFVADFIGTANIARAKCVRVLPDGSLFECPYGVLHASRTDVSEGREYDLCIRPEDLTIGGAEGENRIAGVVEHAVYMGNSLDLFVKAGGELLRASVPKNHEAREGMEACFSVRRDQICIMEGRHENAKKEEAV